VYAVSGYVRRQIQDGVADAQALAPVHVLYLALDDAPPPAQKQDSIVYAGRFIPEKGVLELAQALATVLPDFPQWRAVFLGAWGFGHDAGASAYEKSVYAALAAVPDQVEFRGHVPNADVLAALSAAAIAVVPSTGVEAFGRSLLEAMAAGCAVVAARAGALAEIGDDAVLLVDAVNAAALAERLRVLMADAAQRRLLSQRAVARVAAVFSLPVQAAALDAARAALLGDA
jgi:glycosyltransferase involved in cell wall biosynthesis